MSNAQDWKDFCDKIYNNFSLHEEYQQNQTQ